MRYLLDTDSVSFALRGQGRVAERLLEKGRSEIRVSSITVAELRFGAAAKQSKKLHALIDDFLADVEVVAFDAAAATEYGSIAAQLSGVGLPIGMADAMLAAHAKSLGLVMVTQNVKHFRRVRGLVVENWF
jgi:tRNA(fMet)-specific endonuclease VapC